MTVSRYSCIWSSYNVPAKPSSDCKAFWILKINGKDVNKQVYDEVREREIFQAPIMRRLQQVLKPKWNIEAL